VRKAYRVNDCHEFVVDFKPQSDGSIKIFSPICPPDPYGKGATTHHRYSSGKICVAAGKEPRTYEKAEAIAQYWVERYSGYVTTGTFADTGAKVHV
jgi:hypothetical protein